MHSSTKVQPEQRFWVKGGGLLLASSNTEIFPILKQLCNEVSNYGIFVRWGGQRSTFLVVTASLCSRLAVVFTVQYQEAKERTLKVSLQH